MVILIRRFNEPGPACQALRFEIPGHPAEVWPVDDPIISIGALVPRRPVRPRLAFESVDQCVALAAQLKSIVITHLGNSFLSFGPLLRPFAQGRQHFKKIAAIPC